MVNDLTIPIDRLSSLDEVPMAVFQVNPGAAAAATFSGRVPRQATSIVLIAAAAMTARWDGQAAAAIPADGQVLVPAGSPLRIPLELDQDTTVSVFNTSAAAAGACMVVMRRRRRAPRLPGQE